MSNKDYYQGQQQQGYYPPPGECCRVVFTPRRAYSLSPTRPSTGGLLPSAAAAIIPSSTRLWRAPVRSGRIPTPAPASDRLCVSFDQSPTVRIHWLIVLTPKTTTSTEGRRWWWTFGMFSWNVSLLLCRRYALMSYLYCTSSSLLPFCTRTLRLHFLDDLHFTTS